MNNASLNHFATVPYSLDMPRSRFDRHKRHITSFNAGLLIPIYCSDVLPGDSVKLNVASLVRMSTPFVPVMDNAFLDLHAYFVPNRLVWSNWEEFMGENKQGHWAAPVTHTVPTLTAPTSGGDGVYGSSVSGWAKGSIMNYLGIPMKIGGLSVSQLPLRGYLKIWNDWYRDQNLQDPCSIPLGDGSIAGTNDGLLLGSGETSLWTASRFLAYLDQGGYVTGAYRGGCPLPVNKFHGYFSSALPSPQKSTNPVTIPLGTYAPIKNLDSFVTPTSSTVFTPKFFDSTGAAYISSPTTPRFLAVSGADSNLKYSTSSTMSGTPLDAYQALGADLRNATAASINSLREAFQVMRYFERLARSGSRYIEQIKAFFGVTSPDGRLQRSEFLGGKRIPINMTQVAQTAQSSGGNGVGQLGAFSQTLDSDVLFSHSFVEHGYLFVMAMVRTERSYQQGVPRHFSRSVLTDFYNPTFANLGEQAILRKEIYATGSSANDDAVFGYQEAWADYRYEQNQISGELSSLYATPLDQWHYGDYYASAPTLSSAWIREPQVNVERTIAVASQDQFIGDFEINGVWSRVMPLYSVPGLIDHH